MRRVHLRGRDNIRKRLLVHAGGLNLGLLVRTLLGVVSVPEGVAMRLREAAKKLDGCGYTERIGRWGWPQDLESTQLRACPGVRCWRSVGSSRRVADFRVLLSPAGGGGIISNRAVDFGNYPVRKPIALNSR